MIVFMVGSESKDSMYSLCRPSYVILLIKWCTPGVVHRLLMAMCSKWFF